jgi:hypothetical protein
VPEGVVAGLMGARGSAGPGPALLLLLLLLLGTSLRVASGASFFSIWGGRSVVLCFPWVHGSISRNSSKVRTRGLQHFHPVGRLGSVSRGLPVGKPHDEERQVG